MCMISGVIPRQTRAVPGRNNNEMQAWKRYRAAVADRKARERLEEAVSLGDAQTLAALLDAGTDANARTPNGMTLLMHAAYGGHTETARLLLEHGADVNAMMPTNGFTALMYTTQSRDGNPETARLLLARGADVDAADASGKTTLMMAATSDRLLEAVCTLLDSGAQVNRLDMDDMTALLRAIMLKAPGMVRLLVERGADVNLAGNNGRSALQIALNHPNGTDPDTVDVLRRAGAL
jgi:ankyrin repeat protein